MFGGFPQNDSADVLRRPLNTVDSQNFSAVIPQSSLLINGNAGQHQRDSFQGFRSNDLETDLSPQQQQPIPQRFVLRGPNNPLANRSGPRYPEYALKTVRITSFRSWSTTLKPAELLAEAGFFSTSKCI